MYSLPDHKSLKVIYIIIIIIIIIIFMIRINVVSFQIIFWFGENVYNEIILPFLDHISIKSVLLIHSYALVERYKRSYLTCYLILYVYTFILKNCLFKNTQQFTRT